MSELEQELRQALELSPPKYPKIRLHVVQMELRDANEFVAKHHRHHKPVQGHRFSIGAATDDGEVVAVAIVGRPTSGLDPRSILEVVRMCSDGTFNACSFLYAAAARIGKELGYKRIQTYIFAEEPGTTLKASGWKFERKAHPSGRHRKRSDGAPRDTTFVAKQKTLWVKDLSGDGSAEWAHHRRSI